MNTSPEHAREIAALLHRLKAASVDAWQIAIDGSCDELTDAELIWNLRRLISALEG